MTGMEMLLRNVLGEARVKEFIALADTLVNGVREVSTRLASIENRLTEIERRLSISENADLPRLTNGKDHHDGQAV